MVVFFIKKYGDVALQRLYTEIEIIYFNQQPVTTYYIVAFRLLIGNQSVRDC